MNKAHQSYISPDATVLFATFSLWTKGKRMPTNGSVEPLRDFLLPRVSRLVLIDQLAPGSEDVMHKIEVYERPRKTPRIYKPSLFFLLLQPYMLFRNFTGTHVSFKVRDFLSVIDWALRDGKRYDYFIGLESINACAGIFLRFFGRVGKVIYYVSDYSPNRYPKRWFNAIYLWLDRFSARHADYIWDVSKAIHPARIQAGLRLDVSAPVIHVANGLFPSQIKIAPLKDIRPHAIVFMGTLGPENGPDVAVRALSLVRKKYPDATLHLIGGTPQSFEWLRPIIHEHHQDDAVIYHGFVPDAASMARIMRTCAVAVAPYRAVSGSPRYYGDAGKIRAYCAAGLPIVSSRVPPLGREVADKGAALLADDNEQGFSSAIMKLFADAPFYLAMRKKAIALARTNTWEHQFAKAFAEMHTIDTGRR